MAELEEGVWDPNAVRKVEDLAGMRELVFDALADPLARMSCACEDCMPSPHESTSLGSFKGTLEVEIDGKFYKIEVTEWDGLTAE